MLQKFFSSKLFLLAFIFVALVVTFSQDIITLLIDIELKAFSEKHLGQQLQYEEILFASNGVCIKNVHTPPSQEPLAFQGDLELSFRMDWWNKQLLVDACLKNARCKASRSAPIVELAKQSPSTFSLPFPLSSKFTVEKAFCQLKDQKAQEVSFYIDIEQRVRDSRDVNLNLYFHPDQTPALHCQLSDFHRYVNADLHFSKAPALPLSRIFSYMECFPSSLQILSGNLEGKINIDFFSQQDLRLNKALLDVEALNLKEESYSFYLSKVSTEMRPIIQTSMEASFPHHRKDIFQQFMDGLRRFDFLDNQSRGLFHAKDLLALDISQVGGRAYRNLGQDLQFDFKAQVYNQEKSMGVQLLGRSFFNHQFFRNILGNIYLLDGQDLHTVAYGIKESSPFHQNISLHFTDFSSDLLRFIFPPSFRSFDSWYLSKGNFSGSLLFDFEMGKLAKVYSEDVLAHAFSMHSKALSLSFEEVKGRLMWDFQQAKGNELSLNLQLEKGDFSSLSFDMGYFQVKNIFGQLALEKGFLDKALLNFHLDNIRSSFFWDDHLAISPMQFTFEGKIKDIIRRIAPDKFLKGEYPPEFLEQNFSLTGKGSKSEEKMLVGGAFTLDDPSYLQEPLPFQGDFSLYPEESFMKDSFLRLANYRGGVGEFFTNFFLGKENLGAYRFDYLKFWGSGVDIDPFISTYLFESREKFTLKGRGNLQGYLKATGLLLEYEVQEAQITHPSFTISTPSLGQKNDKEEGLRAKHYVDFLSGVHHGYIPIEKARYEDRHFGLDFQDVYASMYLMEDKIVFENTHTHFDGVQFLGSLEVDYGKEQSVHLKVRPQECSGSLQGANKFFHKLSSKGKAMQLEGFFQLFPHSYLDVTFQKQAPSFDMLLEGQLGDVEGKLEGWEGYVHKVDGEFYYDQKQLDIGIQRGQLRLNPSKELSIDKSRLCFHHFPDWSLHFDCGFQKGKHRFKGSAQPEEYGDGKVYRFAFNPANTFIGKVLPCVQEMTLRDFKELMTFRATPSFNFSTLADDLRALEAFSLLPSFGQLPSLGKIQGIAKGNLDFDKTSNQYHYQFSAKDLSVNGEVFERFFLNGRVKPEHLYLESLYMDDLFLTADLQRQEEKICVNSLDFFCQEGLRLQIKDGFAKKQGAFYSQIKSLAIDWGFVKKRFAKLLNPYLSYLPEGSSKLRGSLDLDEEKVRSSWEVYEHNLSYLGHQVFQPFSFSLDYLPQGELEIRDCQLLLQSSPHSQPGIFLDIHTLGFSSTRKVRVANSTIRMKKNELASALQAVQSFSLSGQELYAKEFEKFVEEESQELFCQVNGEWEATDFSLDLLFPSGNYALFMPQPLFFEKLRVLINPSHWELQAQYLIQDKPLNFALQKVNDKEGLLRCYFSHQADTEGVLAKWRQEGEELEVLEVGGSLPGIEGHFQKDAVLTDQKEIVLQGKASIDFQKMQPYVPTWLQEAFTQLALGEGYTLEGEVFIPRSFASPVFKGSLKGKDFECLGTTLDKLFSKIEMRKDKLQIFETFAKDNLGSFYIDTITLAKQAQGLWELSLPLIRVEDFYPKLFQSWGKDKKSQEMMISLGELRGFKGVLGENKSFKGSGIFEFKNVSKTFMFTPLLLIPGEIIARIGLDPSVLSPHMGTVLFEFGDGVIYVKEFRDVYSKGRRSKFDLAQGSPSFIEFDGSLNLRLKIEYYSLLLKPLDLMTVTMKGYLHKPVYTIQKSKQKEIVKIGM